MARNTSNFRKLVADAFSTYHVSTVFETGRYLVLSFESYMDINFTEAVFVSDEKADWVEEMNADIWRSMGWEIVYVTTDQQGLSTVKFRDLEYVEVEDSLAPDGL